jgi:hypothetical protein
LERAHDLDGGHVPALLAVLADLPYGEDNAPDDRGPSDDFREIG